MPWFVKHIARIHAKHLSNYNLKTARKIANKIYVKCHENALF